MDVGSLTSGSSAFSNPAWTSGGSQFIYYWSLAWRILSIPLLACEMSLVVWEFEHSFIALLGILTLGFNSRPPSGQLTSLNFTKFTYFIWVFPSYIHTHTHTHTHIYLYMNVKYCYCELPLWSHYYSKANLQGIFPTQESNPGLLHCRQTLYRYIYMNVRYCYCELPLWSHCCSKANVAYSQVVNFCFVLFSPDRYDFEWAIWDPEGTKSHSHFQQRRKPLCNRGIDPMSRELFSDDS